jgi:hypothetical protein
LYNDLITYYNKGQNTVFEKAKVTNRDRKVIYSFDGPVLESTPEDGADIWNERIKVTMSHNKDKKRYEAYISWCKASSRGAFSVEQHAIFTDPMVEFATASAARYSENNFGVFCSEVIAMANVIVADPELATGPAADLLRKAQGFVVVAA